MKFDKWLFYSIIIHAIVLGIFFVGLPHWHSRVDPEQIAITMEILPISNVSNVKPVHTSPAIKQDVKDNPPKPQKKENTQEIIEKEPLKTPITKATDKQETVIPQNTIDNGIKSDNKEKKKDNPEKNIEKKEKPKEKNEDKLDVDALLKNLDEKTAKKIKEKPDKKLSKQQEDESFKELENELNNLSEGPHEESKPLSISEKDLIINQIYKCWNVPIGAKNIENTKISIFVNLRVDGSVQDAKISKENVISDLAHRTLAESALRAVHKCSPIKGLPANKYDHWKEINLVFNPSDLIY